MPFEDAEGLKKKIKALIAFRVVFVTFFFAISFFFRGFERFPHVYSLYYLISSFYILTIVYSLLLGRATGCPGRPGRGCTKSKRNGGRHRNRRSPEPVRGITAIPKTGLWAGPPTAGS